MEYIKLNDDGQVPNIGFGTWNLEEGPQAFKAVVAALEAGYRLIDTAKVYGNETSVGKAVRQSGLDRQEIFVTTKLWPGDFGRHSALAAFNDSLSRLGMEYIDLYLLHWPGHDPRLRRESWQVLEEIKGSGAAKHIGVSNYYVGHLEELTSYAQVPPAVNQIEFHPFIYSQQAETLNFCHRKDIAVEAYSPLAQAHNLKNETLNEIAGRHGKTPAQVMIRWAIQHGTIPIPKSAHKERIKENIEDFDFKLSQEQIKQIDSLSEGASAFT